MTNDPFNEFNRFKSDLLNSLGLKPENDIKDTKSYPIGGEARIFIDDDARRIARLELHGNFQDPYHLIIMTGEKNVADAARTLFTQAKGYRLGNTYLHNEKNPQDGREKLNN